MALWDAISKNNTQTAYQKNMAQPVKQDKWYKGDSPTLRETLGRMDYLGRNNPTAAKKAKETFGILMSTPGFDLYQPYLQTTNRAVQNLQDYGFDTSTLTDDWFAKNRDWERYLVYNGTTNAPSSPGTKATTQQKVAYQLWQYSKARKDTANVGKEWAAMKEELSYWANRKDLNMSDDAIVERVKKEMQKKYPTLNRLYNSVQPGSGEAIVELNSATDFSEDAMYGVLWAARNNGGTGDVFSDMANSARGLGNTWKENPLIKSKLTYGDPNYSPYSVGSTMEDEGLYFGVSEFNQRWIDENAAKYLNGNDETAKKFCQNVIEAEEYTQKLESELSQMKEEINSLFAANVYDVDTIIDYIKSGDSYKDLFALDKSMKKADLKKTTRAVNYRWQDVEDMIRAKCDEMKNALSPVGIAAAVSLVSSTKANSFNSGNPPTVRDIALELAVSSALPNVSGTGFNAAGLTLDNVSDDILRKSYDSKYGQGAFDAAIKNEEVTDVLSKIPAPDVRSAIDTAKAGDKQGALNSIYYYAYGKTLDTTKPEETIKAQDLLDKATKDAIGNAESEPVATSPFDEIELANDAAVKADMDTIDTAVQDFGTDIEKVTAAAGKTNLFDKSEEEIIRADGDFEGAYQTQSTEKVVNDYWGVYGTISGYGKHKENRDASQEYLDTVNARLGELNSRTNVVIASQGLTKAENEALNNINPAELEYCVSEAESGDRESALKQIYFSVYGEEPSSNREIAKAGYMLDAVLDAKPLSKEESNELYNLERQKKILETEVDTENKYLAEHEEEYKQAQIQSNFLKDNYKANAENEGVDPALIDKVEYVYSVGQQKTRIEVPDYDGRVASGESTRADVNDAALQDATKCENEITLIEETLDYLNKIGVSMDDESVKNIQARLSSLRNVAYVAGCAALDGIDGFEESVNKGKEIAKTSDSEIVKAVEGKLVSVTTPEGYGVSQTADFLNPQDERAYLAEAMTPEEKNRFYYLLSEDVKSAEKYFNALTDKETGVVYQRLENQRYETTKEFANENIFTAAIATAASFATKAMSVPEELLRGDYSYRNATNALRSGSAEALIDLFGAKGTDAEWWLQTGYNILTGIVDYKISSKAVEGFLGLLGGALEGSKVAGFLTKIGAKIGEKGVNLAKGMSEVLPMSIYDASGTYQNVYNQTHDETKAAQMAYVEFLMGTISHTIIAQGMHSTYKANPESFTEGVAGLVSEMFKTAGVFGGTSLATNTLQSIVENAVLEGDSQWGQSVEKYKAAGYPTAIAEKMADSDMRNYILSKTGEQVVTAMLRTAVTYTAGAVKNSEKLKETVYKLKDSIRSRLQKSQGEINGRTYIIDEAGNIVVNSGLGLPGETGYSEIQSITPTKVTNYKTGENVTIVGYRYDTAMKQFMYVTENGKSIPFRDMFSTEVLNDVMDLTDDEFSLLLDSYAWVNKNFGSTSTAEPAAEPASEPSAAAESGEASTSSPVSAAPIATTASYPEGASSPVLNKNMTYKTAKDMYIAQSIFLADKEAAAVGTAAILNTGNADTDRAAGQSFISKICGGRTDVAAAVIGKTLIEAKGNPTQINIGNIKDAIVYGALTEGKANARLMDIVEKVKAGTPITADDVKALQEGLQSDKTYPAIQDQLEKSIKGSVMANATLKIASSKASEVKKAKAKTKTAKKNLAYAKTAAEKAHEELAASAKSHIEAAQTYAPADPNAPVDPQNANLLQTTREKLMGDKNAAEAADAAVAVQERKVEEAESEEKDVESRVLTEARQEAEQVVKQREADNQAVVRNAQAKSPQVVPFDRPYQARLIATGEPIQLLGVLASVREHAIYSTPIGYVTDDLLNYEGTTLPKGVLKVLDQWNNERKSARRRNPVNPVEWFNHSIKGTLPNGETVDIIGVAGINGPDTILTSADGRQFRSDDVSFGTNPGDDPITGGSAEDSFFELTDSLDYDGLPEVEEGAIANVTADSEGENGTETGPVQPEEEGNNPAELAATSGSDVRPGDNTNVEPRAEEGSSGRGETGEAEHNGSPVGRRDERLRNLIDERLHLVVDKMGRVKKQEATDPHLSETRDYGLFSSALEQAKSVNPHAAYTDSQTPESLAEKGAITLISEDGSSGVAIGTRNGDAGNIFGMFSNGTAKNTMPYLVIHAILNGGIKTDEYDGVMSRALEQFGFIPVARVPFDKARAPKNWNYERDKQPDVIVWMHNGDAADTVARRYMFTESQGGYHRYKDKEISELPVFNSYDEALAYRDRVLFQRYHAVDTVVTHGVSVKNAKIALKEGGFAGPSLAVTKEGQESGAYNFGSEKGQNVVVLFGESSIDPSDPRNVLLGDDAFTATFPSNVAYGENGFYDKESGDPVSLEDIVLMMFQNGAVTEGITKRYNSIAEMKADSGRLVSTGTDAIEYSQPINDVDQAARVLAKAITDKSALDSKSEDEFEDEVSDKLSSNLHKFYRPNMTAKEMQEALAGLGIIVSEEAAADYKDAIDKAVGELTDYFEAKLMRVAGIDEVVGMVIPEGETELASMLDEKGIPYLYHNTENRAAQVAALSKSLREPKTPVDSNGEAVITPPTANEPSTEPSVSAPSTSSPVNVPPTNPPGGSTPPTEFPVKEGPMRQFNAKTAQEGKLLHEQTKKHLLENGVYDPKENEEQIDNALSWVDSHATESDPTGFWAAMDEAMSDDFNTLSIDGQARLLVLMEMASTNGLTDAETRIADRYGESGTDVAQALAIRRVFKLMTPAGRKSVLEKECKKIEEEYRARGKKNLKLKISKEVMDKAANAKSADEFMEAQKQMEKELAAQIPSDWRLRMRTIRMAAMLANPRTHIRNLEGNFLFRFPLAVKNAIAAGLEKAVKVPVGERTKSIRKSPEALEYARKQAEEQKEILQGTAKYFEVSAVEANRKGLGSGEGRTAVGRFVSRTLGKATQWASDKNSDILEREDWISLNQHFVNALAGFMTANGYTEKDMTGATKAKALAYAILEAQKATYRDFNKTARWLSDQSNKPEWLQFGINAILPFTKTPMNIVKRGVEYSPIGLASSLATAKHGLDLYKEWEDNKFEGKKPKGAKSPGEAIDAIAAGMTGTMLAGLGALLSRLGILVVKPTESEKRKGVQEYSVNLFGHSFGIQNMVPSALPLLLGGSVAEEIEKLKNGEETDIWSVLQAVGNMAQPTVETTMFMSLNSMLETNKYSDYGDVTASAFVQKMLANYTSSFVPSFVGAVTKGLVDTTRRKSYTMSGDKGKIWNQLVEQVQNKLPGLSQYNVPYLNAWGEPETNNPVMAFLENFILPDRITEIKDSELDDILDEISESGVNVNPSTSAKTLAVNGENKKLTDKQWYQYHSTRLPLAKERLNELIERPEFFTLEDKEVQANLIKRVYQLANAKAALELFPEKKLDGWTTGALAAEEQGKLIDYIFEKEEEKAQDAIKSESRSSLVMAVEQNNMDAAKVDLDILRKSGSKDSDIRATVTKKIKPLYKEAFESGDYDEMNRIKAFLISLGIGYDSGDFTKWLKSK